MIDENPTQKPKTKKIDGIKGKIYKLKNSSSQLIISKRTIPEGFKFENEYLCVLKTGEGLVKFKTKKFKHKSLVRFKIPKAISDTYITKDVTNVYISLIYIKDEDSYFMVVVENELSDSFISLFYPKYFVTLYITGDAK